MGVDWPWIIALILLVRGLGLDMIGLSLMSSAIRELHTTREELARLKVEEERQRMARDLHDLLGHTLSLITLKSKLAGRLVEREPARAVQEIAEIEHIARQTLREVREAVAGYRQPRLENEVDGARQLLEAAGIACSLEYSARSLPPVTDAALAWTVREGVTNVIRHSRAQHCFIRLTREHSTAHAEVINDGDPRERAGGAHAREGLGLSGLAERVTALGGRIEAGKVASDGKSRLSPVGGTADPESWRDNAGGASMIRVLLAEDQAMVRGALSALLGLEEDIEVVAEVARGDEVVAAARTARPDVALLDIEMPGGGGLPAAQALTRVPAILPRRDPDYLWTQRLPAPGDGERSSRVPAQGCTCRRPTRCHPPRHARRAGR